MILAVVVLPVYALCVVNGVCCGKGPSDCCRALYQGVQYKMHAEIPKHALLLGSHNMEIQELDPACSTVGWSRRASFAEDAATSAGISRR